MIFWSPMSDYSVWEEMTVISCHGCGPWMCARTTPGIHVTVHVKGFPFSLASSPTLYSRACKVVL